MRTPKLLIAAASLTAGLLFAAGSSCQARQIEPEFFGLHMHRALTSTPWPDVPFYGLRLWDTHTSWRDLEPRPNDWVFDSLDRLVGMAELAGVEVMLTLGNTPQWASSRPDEPCAYGLGCAAEPRSVDDWRRYVEKVVSRYKGRIRTYEIWNEVRFTELEDTLSPGRRAQTYSGSAVKMVELAKVAYRVIKEIDPAAKVASPSIHVYGDWIKKLDLYLALGGRTVTDVVSFHFYAKNPEASLRTIDRVKNVLARHNLQDHELWNTEVGYLVHGDANAGNSAALPEELVGAYVVRTLVLNASVGVRRVYWYAWDNYKYGLWGTAGRRENLAGAAYRRAVTWLLGAAVNKCSRDSRGLWQCDLRRGDKRQTLVWSDSGDVTIEVVNKSLAAYEPLYSSSLIPTPIGATTQLRVGQVPVLLELDLADAPNRGQTLSPKLN